MIVIAGVLCGGVFGALTAKKRQGSGADIAQFATVYAIAFGLLGFIVTIGIEKAL